MVSVKASAAEKKEFLQSQIDEIEKWWSEPRWKDTKRIYSAYEIAKRRGSVKPNTFPSTVMSQKLFKILGEHAKNGTVSKTFGALDPVQVTQMSKYLDTIYVSGWQCSSTASTSNEPGPDLADYPMDTVPNKVEHLFKAQQFHDRKQWERICDGTIEESEIIDYLTPIVADGDAGHGGLTAVFKLTKMFIERGAAGIHIEDQTSTNKKCGHMAGRCVIPVQEHINRLITCRMAADVLGSDLILVARTDSEAATLLSSTADSRDHYFILGASNPAVKGKPLNDLLNKAILDGATIDDLQTIEKEWLAKADVKLFHEVFADAAKAAGKDQSVIDQFNSKVNPLSETSIYEMQALAKELLGTELFFDWDLPRGREGLYRYQGGTQCSVMRARAFAPYADLCWMESNYPDYEQAKEFAEGVTAKFPGKWMAYNLSPSFNWTKAMSVDEQETFIQRLGDLGYIWQFITLAGLHTSGLAIEQFSKNFAKFGMKAYAQDIQKKELDNGIDMVKHQKWSGAEYIDGLLRLAQGGLAATAAMGQGVTEDQFK